MIRHAKKYQDQEEFKKANIAFTEYQKRHNILLKDYELLLEITKSVRGDQDKFDTQVRAALKGFFSLVESDIFGLNQLDPYKEYSDKHSFEVKFKRTFKQICKTWDKQDIIQNYLDSRFASLNKVRKKRDNLVHPKSTEDIIIATDEEFEELKFVFDEYVKMLHSIMNNFFIRVNIQNTKDLKNIFVNQ